MEEKLMKVVIYVCPECGWTGVIPTERLMKFFHFDGKSLKTARKLPCRNCRVFEAKPSFIDEVAVSWFNSL